eukprot:6653759-Pyramimonas_sp.AAC.1
MPATATAGDRKGATGSNKRKEHIKQLVNSLTSCNILLGEVGKEACQSLEKQLPETKRSLAEAKPEFTQHTN